MFVTKLRCCSLMVIIIVLLLSTVTAAQSLADVRVLNPSKPIQRELVSSVVHGYSINLMAGQFLSMIVDQRGIDVVVALFGPDGKQIAGGDSLSYFKVAVPVPLTIVTNTTGSYRLDVRSLKRDVAAGSYEIKIEELRAEIGRG